MTKIVLNKTRFRTKATVNLHGLDCHISTQENVVLNQLIYELEANLWSQKQTPYVYSTYATWLDHLKDTLPPWLKKYVKVNKTKHSLDIKTVYPNVNIRLPDSYDNTAIVYVSDFRIGMMKPEKDPYELCRPNSSI
jgi:hypothetical protein